jgi:hypothetical protein
MGIRTISTQPDIDNSRPLDVALWGLRVGFYATLQARARLLDVNARTRHEMIRISELLAHMYDGGVSDSEE